MKEIYCKGRVYWWKNGEQVNSFYLNKADMKELNVAVGEADRLEILNKSVYDVIINKINNYVKIIVKKRDA